LYELITVVGSGGSNCECYIKQSLCVCVIEVLKKIKTKWPCEE
jgi:hypothetical protein